MTVQAAIYHYLEHRDRVTAPEKTQSLALGAAAIVCLAAGALMGLRLGRR